MPNSSRQILLPNPCNGSFETCPHQIANMLVAGGKFEPSWPHTCGEPVRQKLRAAVLHISNLRCSYSAFTRITRKKVQAKTRQSKTASLMLSPKHAGGKNWAALFLSLYAPASNRGTACEITLVPVTYTKTATDADTNASTRWRHRFPCVLLTTLNRRLEHAGMSSCSKECHELNIHPGRG